MKLFFEVGYSNNIHKIRSNMMTNKHSSLSHHIILLIISKFLLLKHFKIKLDKNLILMRTIAMINKFLKKLCLNFLRITFMTPK